MTACDLALEMGHEEVLVAQDATAGLHAVVAIHDTTFGPAVGGTRMRLYPTFDDAVTDALRLSRAMTYKAVMAEMPYGGGKAVIMGDPARDKTRALLAAYARVVERFDGRFFTGGDMGIEPRDVVLMARWTKHVAHAVPSSSSVDTGELAALGIAESIRAVASRLGCDLAELHVAVQGLGQVGWHLARRLAAEGARLTVADVDVARVEAAVAELGAAAVAPEAIYDVEADVFSPNAVGGVINDATLPRLRGRAVIGGANDQLAGPHHGDALHARGVLYAPDYLVNAGGLLSLLYESGKTDEAGLIDHVKEIGPRLGRVLDQARAEGLAPHRMADRVVEERLTESRRKLGRPAVRAGR